MKKVLAALAGALALAALGSHAALAQPAYSADDILRQLAPSEGRSRGVCIGSEVECQPKAAAPAAPAPAATPQAAVVTQSRLRDPSFDLLVTFRTNSDALTPAAKANLDEFAKAAKHERLKAVSFIVEGHTDAKGDPQRNLLLSKRRADSVVRYLGEKGVETARLIPRGLGDKHPRTANPRDAANRRVEARLNNRS